METPRYIHNHKAVIDAFGYSPSFSDLSILAFEHTTDCITLALHVCEMVLRRDEDEPYNDLKNCIVRFTFRGITQVNIAQFSPANILSELVFSPSSEFDDAGQFAVGLGSVTRGDHRGSFIATFGEVTAVLLCDEHGQPA